MSSALAAVRWWRRIWRGLRGDGAGDVRRWLRGESAGEAEVRRAVETWRRSHPEEGAAARAWVPLRAQVYATLELREWARGELALHLRRLRAGEQRYRGVESGCGVPWQVVGALHQVESGGDFERELGGGRPIDEMWWSWEEEASGELHRRRLAGADWTRAETGLLAVEIYGGLGYARRGAASPFVWCGTTHYRRGMIDDDGEWHAEVEVLELGAAPLLRALGMWV